MYVCVPLQKLYPCALCRHARAGGFAKAIALLHSSEESLRRECVIVLTHPWSLHLGITAPVAELLFKEGVIQVCCCMGGCCKGCCFC